MGWGNDFVWPVLAEKHNLKMGIVDAVPVGHNLRKPVAYYNYGTSADAMRNYLATQPHLSKKTPFLYWSLMSVKMLTAPPVCSGQC